MGKRGTVKLERSRVSKRKKATENESSGSSPSGVKRARESSDADSQDQAPKRMKNLIEPKLEYNPAPEVIDVKYVPLSPQPQQDHAAALAMSIFQIRLAVFKHLPVSSLLQFALVCKDWYDETRSVIEKFKNCVAYIAGHQPCFDLLNLNNEIPWMTKLPFNTLNIKDFRDHQPCFSSHEKFDMNKFLGNILALPLKTLEINQNRYMGSHCLASSLLREAVRGRYPTIEQMILPVLSSMETYLREEDFLKQNSLPNLKCLESKMISSSKPLFLLAIRSAPNIQEILMPLQVSSVKNELESLTSNKLKLVKWLLLQPNYLAHFEILRLRSFTCGLRRLEVMEPVDMRTDKYWIKTLKILLESSRSTLEFLSLSNHELLLSLDRTVKPFPSLKYLQICVASMTDQLPVILDRSRLGFLFPNLIGIRIFFNQLSAKQAVNLDTTTDTFPSFVNKDGNSQLWPPLRRLEFRVAPARSFSCGIFEHFAQKCPQITGFVYKGHGEKFLNYQILTCFPHLKRLKLMVMANHVAHLDEFLCGLDAEEVKDLWELSVEKLNQIHIVPRRHCLNNLTDLKHFKLVIGRADKLKDNQSRQKGMLSYVTGVLIFSRWPSLKVEINCHLDRPSNMYNQALSHLSPFAQVNYITRY